MNLSKSKYCNAVQCLKKLYLDENYPECAEEVNNDSVLENGTKVGELARNLFKNNITIDFCEDLNQMVIDTKSLLLNNKITISEASFKYENNFCSVDILKKDKNELEVYEVKSSTNIKDIYIDDISYQVYILLNLGYKIKSANIVYVNNNYERNGELELNKLFNIEDITEKVFDKQNEIKNKLKEINNINDEPNIDIGIHCFNPYDCPYFKYCTQFIDKNNVFNIRTMSNKEKISLYKKGSYKYKDLLNEEIKDKYKQQIEFELYDKEDYIDKIKIKEFLNTLSFPLYFLDFESFQQVIPEYNKVKPYMQIPFQYSLHYIENNELKHKEFLANSNYDPRYELAKQLVNDIPKDVCVLAYNMSFEKTIIKSLAALYPKLSEHLMNIHDNIKDLMIPFKDRYYYTKDMKGSYSIKYVLPALFKDDEALNYHNLELIHNGSEAMNEFANLKYKSEEEQEYIRKRLLEYCKLDTYAMVKIYEKLIEIEDE